MTATQPAAAEPAWGPPDPAAIVPETIASLGRAGLLAARAEMRRLVQDEGIRHGSAGPAAVARAELDHAGPAWHPQGRNWVIDPLPVVVGAREWRDLERGLVQRAHLLRLVLADLHGPRRLVAQGLLPPEVVLAHPGFVPQAIAPDAAGRAGLLQTSADLGRGDDGRWTVIADRSSTSVGVGYAMATRRITSRVMAALHRRVAPSRLRGFFHTTTAALLDAAPEGVHSPRAVLLSPGTGSDTSFEDGFLATLLGLPVVEAEDLTMEGGRLWISSGAGREAVDVVLRRVDSRDADPLDLRAASRTGVPGLLEAVRRGTVAVVNPLGAEVVDNPGLHPFLPGICRAVLGEELLLPAVETHWCGDPAGLAHVLAHLETLVVKPVRHDTAAATLCGWLLPQRKRAELRDRILAAPWAWVGQRAVPLSDVPVVTPTGLETRRLVLRTFGVSRGGDVEVLQGGLGRVSPEDGTWIVPVMGSGIAKDVWVLPAEAGGRERVELLGVRDTLPAAPVRRRALAPRVAENLFWVGRYGERTDATTRLLRVVDDLVEDHGGRPGTPGHATAQVMRGALEALTQLPAEPGESPQAHLRRLVTDTATRGTIGYAVARLVAAAQEVRDVLSHDLWHVLSRLERTVVMTPPVDEQLQPQLYDLLESTLAVQGVVGESLVRDASWGWIDAGLRLERAQHTLALLRACLVGHHPPLVDAQVAEAVLEAGESIITHRRRAVAGEGPTRPALAAVAILLLDPTNPRSVAFQLGRLADDLALVGARRLADEAAAIAGRLAGTPPAREELLDLVAAVAADLRDVSRALGHDHFARAARPTVLAADWSAGGAA